jgi:hypothetical protein
MQMNNIFKKSIIANYIFGLYYNLNFIKPNLYYYLFNNLYIENHNIFIFDLKNTLTINANGKYIY